MLHRVEGDRALRALVLTGAGRAFSTGRDLKEQDALTATPPERDDVIAVVEQYQELTRRLTRMDKVVICAINGVAVAIAAELATASDIRLASPPARIAFPEVRRALFLTNGVLYRLPRIVGLGRATDWILSGRMIESDEMLASEFCLASGRLRVTSRPGRADGRGDGGQRANSDAPRKGTARPCLRRRSGDDARAGARCAGGLRRKR